MNDRDALLRKEKRYKRLTIVFVIGCAIIFALIIVTQASAAPLVNKATTQEVQMILVHHGYSLDIDGDYGPKTEKAVRHWQKVNGLFVDGVPGIITMQSLRLSINGPAEASVVPAKRLNPPSQPIKSIEQIIRDIWPDNTEDWAVKIATRESNLQPSVRNACCIGLFQIHFYAHRRWLSDYGANNQNDLFDPVINTRVALALFNEAGVGPWLCHGQCKDIPL